MQLNTKYERGFLLFQLSLFFVASNHMREEISQFFGKTYLDCKFTPVDTTFNIGKPFQCKNRKEKL